MELQGIPRQYSVTMKKIYFPIIALLLIRLVIPFNIHGMSMYNDISGAIYCKSHESCWHEIGHWMDSDLGHPSRSEDFSLALWLYLYMKFRTDEGDSFTDMTLQSMQYEEMFSFPFGVNQFSSPQEELYSNFFAFVNGDVNKLPDIFQKFYSQDSKYIELHDCLMSARLKLCGTALYIEKR